MPRLPCQHSISQDLKFENRSVVFSTQGKEEPFRFRLVGQTVKQPGFQRILHWLLSKDNEIGESYKNGEKY